MKHLTIGLTIATLMTGCASMNDSLILGAGVGAAAGGAATAAGYSAGGKSASFENVAVGAAIGTAVGLITSYFTHKSVEESRKYLDNKDFEMHFGDLPPSPFVVPKTPLKKGAR